VGKSGLRQYEDQGFFNANSGRRFLCSTLLFDVDA
jgi:hypothetical protein